MEDLLNKRRREFRTFGLVLFEIAAGLLISRIVASLIADSVPDMALDAIFTILMQVVFLVAVPFVTYKLALGRSVKGVLEFSNVRKTKWYYLLLAVPLGILCLFVTMGISTIWMSILIMLGYDPGSSTPLPETFSVGMLLAELALTAVLPAICEEFANRGGVVTALRGSFSPAATVVLAGVEFGLFHQNITQVFYTFMFGMLISFLVLKTKSLFPGMIVHFINNGLSVYLDYAEAYDMPLGGLVNSISEMITNEFSLAMFLWALCVMAGAGIIGAIVYLSRSGKKGPVRGKNHDARGDVFDDRVGNYDTDAGNYDTRVGVYDTRGAVGRAEESGEEPKETDPPLENRILYRPVASDWAFHIGALVMTVLTTVLTFAFGLF